MYFPYLRGKKYELLALREVAQRIAEGRKVFPIIEPVRLNIKNLSETLLFYRRYSIPYILITNPLVGQFRGSPGVLARLIDDQKLDMHSRALYGYIISKATGHEDIKEFLDRFSNRHVALIHFHKFDDLPRLIALSQNYKSVLHVLVDKRGGEAYQDDLKSERRVLIRDCFHKRANADYPPDELFTDLHYTYRSRGFRGFGDFTITGKVYSERGSQAQAVAIHLTYLHDNGQIHISHSVSASSVSGEDRAMFFDALKNLIGFLNAHPELSWSTACEEFRSLFRKKEYTDLGTLKGLSIKHHLELMNRIL